jgi:hypothetical protein
MQEPKFAPIFRKWIGSLVVGTVWLGMEYSHKRYETNIMKRFNCVVSNGPNISYSKRLLLLEYFTQAIRVCDLENILELVTINSKSLEHQMPEFYYHTFLNYLSVYGDSVWSDDMNNNSVEFNEYSDKVWKLVSDLYKHRPEIDPYIDARRRELLIIGELSKPPITHTYISQLPTHDSCLNLCVKPQFWFVHKTIQLSIQVCRLFCSWYGNYYSRPIYINGQQVMFWHRNPKIPSGSNNKKVVLFFHGAAIGGMTAYFNALSRISLDEYHLLCYEIPNIAELEYCNTYPSLDMLNLGIIESLKSITDTNETIELSVVGHSLGCDYVASIVQYWDNSDIGLFHERHIIRKNLILIEPFCIMNRNSFMGRRMAFKVPRNFPKYLWNIMIGNLYVQLGIKRSLPRSSSVWINPYNTSWDNWNKHMITSIKDKSVSHSSINDWIVQFAENKWTHTTIQGNHGSWVTIPSITSSIKDLFATLI